MKTNDRIFIAAAAGYSYLFYQQNAGINFLIFNLILITAFVYRDAGLLTNKKWLSATGLCLVTGLSIFIHSSALAIFANCISLLLLSAYSSNRITSVLFSLIFSGWSVFTSFIYILIDGSKRSLAKNGETGNFRGYKATLVIVTLILSLVFFNLYQSANPLFAENTKWITFDFISFPWLLFTTMGVLISYGLLNHKTIPLIESWENGLSVTNKSASDAGDKKIIFEISAGTFLFMALNVMLLLLNIGDIQSIWITGKLPEGMKHPDFVHEGVAIIILSIIMACGLIMFLNRKDFNGSKGYGLLKTAIYFWIIQNLFMLFSTAIRNQIYINSYDLTHFRIGVYAWLTVAAIGLVLTAIKVYNERSNWFLIRSNFSVWICLLAVSSVFNWDNIITDYNLRTKPLKEVDLNYLLSLSDSNIPQLLEITKHKDFQSINNKMKQESIERSHQPTDFNSKLHNKVKDYIDNYTNDWQSWDLRDKRITKSLMN